MTELVHNDASKKDHPLNLVTHAFSEWEFFAFAALIAVVVTALVRASSHVSGLRRDYPCVEELPPGMLAFLPVRTPTLLTRGGLRLAAGRNAVGVAETKLPGRQSGWCLVPWADVSVGRSIVPAHVEVVIGKNGQLAVQVDRDIARQMRLRAAEHWPDPDNELGLDDRFLHVN